MSWARDHHVNGKCTYNAFNSESDIASQSYSGVPNLRYQLTKEADVLPSRAEVVIDDADRTTSSLAYFMFNQQAGMYVVVVCG
jgi:hypothetical protein